MTREQLQGVLETCLQRVITQGLPVNEPELDGVTVEHYEKTYPNPDGTPGAQFFGLEVTSKDGKESFLIHIEKR